MSDRAAAIHFLAPLDGSSAHLTGPDGGLGTGRSSLTDNFRAQNFPAPGHQHVRVVEWVIQGLHIVFDTKCALGQQWVLFIKSPCVEGIWINIDGC